MTRWVTTVIAGALTLSACHGAKPTATPAPSASPSPSAAPSVAPTVAPSVAPTRSASRSLSAYSWWTSPVTTADLGKSWRAGCPVGAPSLRALHVVYFGFDGRSHRGVLVVNVAVVRSVAAAFRMIYDARFPIRRMVPIAAYGGSDDASMAADNTSAFNCRAAVASGPTSWSMHAYGRAIDIDTVENPYTLDGKVYPPAGRPYTDRGDVRPGMIVPGSAPVRAFSAVGWGWGGRWSSSPDYQHFSSNGR